jgi:hypothetical protein
MISTRLTRATGVEVSVGVAVRGGGVKVAVAAAVGVADAARKGVRDGGADGDAARGVA